MANIKVTLAVDITTEQLQKLEDNEAYPQQYQCQLDKDSDKLHTITAFSHSWKHNPCEILEEQFLISQDIDATLPSNLHPIIKQYLCL
jgi:hypothetical protein